MIWQKDYSITILLGIAIVLYFTWAFEIDSITSLSFDFNRKKIEMNRMYEKTKKTANEVEATAATFNKTITAFMNFNLADMQKQGLFDAHIPWQDAAKFVNEARKLRKVLGEVDEETSYLILKSRSKVLDLFVLDASCYFPENKPNIKGLVDSGISVLNGQVMYNLKSTAVDFEGLNALTEQVPADKRTLWKKELSELKKYYEQNF